MLSGVVSISSNVPDAEESTVSVRCLLTFPSLLSLQGSVGAVSRATAPTSSLPKGWDGETSIGSSVIAINAVLGSLVGEMMALKSFVLGLTVPFSEQASAFAGLVGNAVSCACCASTESWAGKESDSWLVNPGDVGLAVDGSWVAGVLTAGFISEI